MDDLLPRLEQFVLDLSTLTSGPSVSGSNCRVGCNMRVTSTLVATTFSWLRLRICLVSSCGFRMLTVPEEIDTHLLTCSKAQWSSVLIPMMDMVVCCCSAIRPIWKTKFKTSVHISKWFFKNERFVLTNVHFKLYTHPLALYFARLYDYLWMTISLAN